MIVVTGITGQVGGVVARTLLAAGKPVRAVVRDAVKGAQWAAQGCAVALADMADADALTAAFRDAEAVFVLLPPDFDPDAQTPATSARITALRTALMAAQPGRVVCLSTIGAQAAEPNLLSKLGEMERVLGDLPMPIASLRAAWFLENFAWDVASARDTGFLPSYLQPLDQPVTMVACADVGRAAADLLTGAPWHGRRIVELAGPQRWSPDDIAAGFARLLGRAVFAKAVPRAQWKTLFTDQGMRNPQPRMRMLDGFNEGWICFEGEAGGAESRHGDVTLDTVLAQLLARAA
jgi:uncharacterized protein YbjT (DUF2867 family)